MAINTLSRTTPAAGHTDTRHVATAHAAQTQPATARTAAVPSAAAHSAADHAAAHLDTVSARGFALYIGLSEKLAAENETTLRQVAEALNRTLQELVPNAGSHAVVALAPKTAQGSDVDLVRLALSEPEITERRKARKNRQRTAAVVIDFGRKQVLLDGEKAQLTFREFELLKFLVLRESLTVSRAELVEGLWADATEAPNNRTIDVHVRRLRAKLGDYEDIILTVRGKGYRFERHADVSIIVPHSQSPDKY